MGLGMAGLACKNDKIPTLGTRISDIQPKELFVSPKGDVLVTLLDAATPVEKKAPRDVSVGSLAVVQVKGGESRVVGSGVTSMPGAFHFNRSGTHLAFLANYSFGNGTGELRLAALQGGEPETLSNNVSFYAFSSDGSNLVWLSEGRLFVRSTEKGEVSQIASDAYTAELGPADSPAEGLVLIKRSARSDGALLVYNLGDKSLKAIAHGVTAFGFSPDGSALAFQGSGLLEAEDVLMHSPFEPSTFERENKPGLYLAAVGKEPIRVAQGASDFVFSPVSATLAYITPPGAGAANGDLHVATLDGESRRVAPRVARMLYGPDGTLALLGAFDGGSGLGTLGLWTLENELIEVSRNVKLFAFSPQGKHITYSYVGDFGAGYSIGLGTRPVAAPREQESRKVDSGVFGWAVSPDDRFLTYKARCEYRARSCDLFVLPLDQELEESPEPAEPQNTQAAEKSKESPYAVLGPRITANPHALKVAEKIAAFDYVGKGQTLAFIQSRPADRTKVRMIYSLGIVPVSGGPIKLLDDGLAGDFVTVGSQKNELAYAVNAAGRKGIHVVQAK